MIIEKKGFKDYLIYDIIKGYLVQHRFLYYTKKQAIREFKLKLGGLK
jgi:hypothetical protein